MYTLDNNVLLMKKHKHFIVEHVCYNMSKPLNMYPTKALILYLK